MIKVGRKGMGQVVPVSHAKRLEYIPGKLILRIREDAVRPHLSTTGLRFTTADARGLPETISEPLNFLKTNAGLKTVRPLFSRRQVQLKRASVSAVERNRLAVLSSVADSTNEDLGGINIADVDPKKLTSSLIKRFKNSPAIDIVEPMPARWAAVAVDPLQNLQWGLRAIGWFGVTVPDAAEINVGMMDTGIDTTHPDLDDIAITYHHNGLSARDLLGHGTHVSGTIAAEVNNGTGISGIAHCRLTCWKIFPDRPEADGEFYVDGERYLDALRVARDAGLRVINLS
ncbi:S8 family serine peptidase, partial [bacterium]|nr:S8 family serine peptidase [bacterium]